MRAKPIAYHQLDASVMHRVFIVDTFACQDPLACVDPTMPRFCHYEIHVAPNPDPEVPRVALITTDLKTFERARAAAERDRRFDATWHRASTKFGLKYEIDRFDER